MKERRVYQSVHGGGEGRRGEGEGTREEEKGPEGTERVQGRRGGGEAHNPETAFQNQHLKTEAKRLQGDRRSINSILRRSMHNEEALSSPSLGDAGPCSS